MVEARHAFRYIEGTAFPFMPADPSENLLDRSLLRQSAGEKAFAQGEQCLEEGRVRQLQVWAERATARVEGTGTYRVRLWQARHELQWSCTCPLGKEGTFCEHAVAVGLGWLQSFAQAKGGGSSPVPAPRQEELHRRERIQKHLQGISHERLIVLLLEATDYDDILRRRLLLESIGVVQAGTGRRRAGPGTPPDLAAYQQILREAIETQDYVDYDALPDYAQGVEEAVHPLGDLLRNGQAAAVIELAEFALVELDKASEMLDGGDGSLNRVYDHLQAFHLEACRTAPPDPEALAARLLHYELEGGLGVFNNAAKAYSNVLGERGLAAWRSLLKAQWNALARPIQAETPAKEPRPIDHRRFQLQALMESLAESDGDLDALLAVKARDLVSPHDFLSLAELCRGASRHPEALAWAERGWREFPERADAAGLRDFLVTALHQVGRDQEALELAWEDFVRSDTPENFQRLKFLAQGASKAWPAYREKALEHLRDPSREQKGTARKRDRPVPPDASVLVEILLVEGDLDQAWAEAQASGCNSDLWLRLAAGREKMDPADALGVYRARLEPTLARGGQAAYREAVALLQKMQAMLTRLNRTAEFATYRAEVRAAHGRKRGFLKLLDAVDP